MTVAHTTYDEGLAAIGEVRPAAAPMLTLLLGSNIGNFDDDDALAFLRRVRGAGRDADWLLLGVDLVKPARDLVLAYDDPLGVTAAFNKNLLVRLNRELGANFDLAAFDHRAVWNAGRSRVEMHLVSRVPQRVLIRRSGSRRRVRGRGVDLDREFQQVHPGQDRRVRRRGGLQRARAVGGRRCRIRAEPDAGDVRRLTAPTRGMAAICVYDERVEGRSDSLVPLPLCRRGDDCMKSTRVVAGLFCAIAAAAVLSAPVLKAGSEPLNYVDINKIKAEGLQRSQVMDLASWLTDVYAPRLTGSPMSQKAAEWTVAKLKEYGLVNVKIEPWVNRNGFERGWTNDKFYLAAVAPEKFPIPGTPTAWTPGTEGLVSGEVALVTATTEADLAAYKGKLKGKWVLTQAAPDVAAYWKPQATRHTAEELAALEAWPAPPQLEFGVTPPGGRAGGPGAPAPAGPPAGGRGAMGAMAARAAFFKAEGRARHVHDGAARATAFTPSAATGRPTRPPRCRPSPSPPSTTGASPACSPRTSR